VFQGTVFQVRLSPQTVQNVVTYDAVINVDNNDLALMPGMTASTQIVVDQRNDVLRVPDQALRYMPGGLAGVGAGKPANGQARVWVLRNGQPVEMPVVPGLDDGNFTEIVKGDLQPDDRSLPPKPAVRPAARLAWRCRISRARLIAARKPCHIRARHPDRRRHPHLLAG
jgi:multidrug efflux pump subunit AcrA (membrane-fusion protein)